MMTSQSKLRPLEKDELADFSVARLRFLAFEAVMELWRLRESQGVKKKDLAERLGRDRGWVSRSLRGPANWTMRTFGSLTAALDGDIELRVHPLERPIEPTPNFHAYVDYPVVYFHETVGDESDDVFSSLEETDGVRIGQVISPTENAEEHA